MLAEVFLVLGCNYATFSSLLDRQADSATLEVEVDDLDPELFAGRNDLFREVDVVRGHLGDVHQTFDSVAHLHERTERHELGDSSIDQFAWLVVRCELLPRILLGGLE